MKWIYDLVILSGSALGFEVALELSAWGRVALVLPKPQGIAMQGSWLRLVLQERLQESFQNHSRQLQGNELQEWLTGQVQRLQIRYSKAVLGAAGVDVIEGEGEFGGGKSLAFQINGDRLDGKTYLLLDALEHSNLSLNLVKLKLKQPDFLYSDFADSSVVDSKASIPENNPSIQETLTLNQAYGRLLEQPCQSWTMIGHGPELAEWIGLAALFGQSVTWYLDRQTLMPLEDEYANQRLQAYLEALGVKIYPQIPELSNWHGQNLTPIQIKTKPDTFLSVNSYLQTRRPNVYACGSWLKGYSLPMVTKTEALSVGANRLKKSRPQPMIYEICPWWLTTPYPLARVGWNLRQLTASQQKHSSRDTQHLKTYQIQASPLGGDRGQIITHKNQLLGATLLGYGAIPTSQSFALGMKKSVPWPDILAIAGWRVI